MKKIALLFSLIATTSFAQVKTSTQNGAFWNIFTWDCTCLPTDGDSLVINHDITLSTGIAFTSGQIKINAGASLSDGGNTLSFYINGGSMINDGLLEIDNLLLDAGFIENNGTANLDSVWTRSTTTNTGTLTTAAFAHDELATFTNSGTLTCIDNFANQGDYINSGVMTVGGNVSNCNIQASKAMFQNDGFFCVTGTYLNCDTLRGTGTMYIGGTSSNTGEVEGTLLVHTSGGSFSANTGTIAGTVTFGTDACAAGVEEEELDEEDVDWLIYPNPATTIINSTEQNVSYNIYDLSGRKVLSGVTFNGVIHIQTLSEGNYTLQLINDSNQISTQPFIKL